MSCLLACSALRLHQSTHASHGLFHPERIFRLYYFPEEMNNTAGYTFTVLEMTTQLAIFVSMSTFNTHLKCLCNREAPARATDL
jgi:hypothetical protein